MWVARYIQGPELPGMQWSRINQRINRVPSAHSFSLEVSYPKTGTPDMAGVHARFLQVHKVHYEMTTHTTGHEVGDAAGAPSVLPACLISASSWQSAPAATCTPCSPSHGTQRSMCPQCLGALPPPHAGARQQTCPAQWCPHAAAEQQHAISTRKQ